MAKSECARAAHVLATSSASVLGVHSAGIDDRLRQHIEDGALFAIARLNSDDLAAALDQPGGFYIIDGCSAKILQGPQQRDGIAGVVKLAVVIENAAAKAVAFNSRQLFERGLAGEQLRPAE